MSIHPSGAVSALVEEEITREVRKKGIVLWLDKHAAYSGLVDALAARHAAGSYPFPVVAFRGSFLELLFALEPYGNSLDKQPLLIHLPGFDYESVRSTPMLELFECSHPVRPSLESMVRSAAVGRVAPDAVEAFLAKSPRLEEADAWLRSAVAANTFGLAARLDEFGPGMLAEALGTGASLLHAQVTDTERLRILRVYLHTLTGMDDAWVAAWAKDAPQDAELPDKEQTARGLARVLGSFAAWILCAEYVHDLKRPAHRESLRRLRDLSAPVVKACVDIAAQLRRDHGDAYVRLADEIEHVLADELKAMTPEDLGQIDTFREEENRVLEGAVAALSAGDWAKAKAWAEARHGDKSFWLQRDQLRRWTWSLVDEAASFGQTLAQYPQPLAGTKSLDAATQTYAAGAFEVDRAHRRFEQRRLALLDSRLPHYGALRDVTTQLRKAHRAWADQLATDFARVCKATSFLPTQALQQRTLFEEVVHPLTLGSDKIAVFMIDAFRYEMATELAHELGSTGTVVDLKPRLAELPSITAVGMNVLAPVSRSGKLTVAGVFRGFRTGEFTVNDPASRARAMGMRSTKQSALLRTLSEVCDASTAALTKEVKPHQLIIVHSKEIDDAGEANVGLPTFESTLRQIKAAWHHLQLAGVKQFVFTADHGFLLQDETTHQQPFGDLRTPQRRHVLDEHPRAEAGMVSVSTSALGYEGVPGYLLFREDTAVWDKGGAGASFVHGGNSPQERVIPVLTVTRKKSEQPGYSEYAVEVEALPDVVGLHRVRVRVVFAKNTTTSLGFVAARSVDLQVRALASTGVEVILKDASGVGSLRAGRVQVPVTEQWTEVFFGLQGPADERVRIEVHHPDKVERVHSAMPDQWYSVVGANRTKASVAPAAAPEAPAPEAPAVAVAILGSWADAIADESIRKVFLHIEKHGAITEVEVTGLLGSARAFRRFSVEFDEHLPKLPFLVRTESGESGKRYVREGDR